MKGRNQEDHGSPKKAQDPPKSSIYSYQIPSAATAIADSNKDDPSKKKVNLWKSILNDVVKRDDQKDSLLLILGDKSAGKRSLIKEINNKFVLARNKYMPVEQMGSNFSALDFSFLYVKDLSDREQLNSIVTSEDNLPRLNIWTIQDSEKGDILEAVLKPGDLS